MELKKLFKSLLLVFFLLDINWGVTGKIYAATNNFIITIPEKNGDNNGNSIDGDEIVFLPGLPQHSPLKRGVIVFDFAKTFDCISIFICKNNENVFGRTLSVEEGTSFSVNLSSYGNGEYTIIVFEEKEQCILANKKVKL